MSNSIVRFNVNVVLFAALTAATVSYSPVALSNLPVCMSASSDADGDGYGWENNDSCIVAAPAASSGGGLPVCLSADSDSDGDGFGWENNDSCRVVTGVVTAAAGPASPSSERPACLLATSDPDGDGFGWENNDTCTVTAATGSNAGSTVISPSPSTPASRPVCLSADSDSDGDGFGWENGDTCVVASSTVNPDAGTADNGNSDNGNNVGTGDTTTEFSAISPSGTLSSGTPVFQWNPLQGAEMYTLAISDSRGNGYSYQIDPLRAGCQSGGTCSATPDLGYYDNDLTWRVKTTVDGSDGPETDRINITTPQNINIQPVKSGQCEAWPSVAYDKYVVLNNTWNSRAMNSDDWSQKIFVNEDNFGNVRPTWTYDWLGQFDGGEIDVKAYPEVLYGPKLGTHVSGTKEETGLPELVRDLPEFVVNYSYSETGTAERNVALESFFHDSCNIAGPCDDVDNRAFEMMIWVENPTIRTPGKLALTGVMIDNRLWNVYIKPDSDPHYIAFTAQDSQPTGTINWNRFVEWTTAWTAEVSEELGIDVLSPEFCMGAIEIGTEMWWGAGSFTLNQFDVSFSR